MGPLIRLAPVLGALIALHLTAATAGAFPFQGGVNSNNDHNPAAADKLGAKEVRVEFPLGTDPAAIESDIRAYGAKGIRVLLLAGFRGRDLSTDQAKADAGKLGTWARAFGPGGSSLNGSPPVQAIEFGNETSFQDQYPGCDPNIPAQLPCYKKRAKDYAVLFKLGHESVKAVNSQVGMLAQADDGGTGSRAWVDGMFEAVPDLASRVAGWTVHPYGPRSRWERRLDNTNSWTTGRGNDNIPIDITEYGIATDNGRTLVDDKGMPSNYGWPANLTYSDAARNLRLTAEDIDARYPRLRRFLIYQDYDLRASGTTSNYQHYFGALKQDLTAKGAYTAEVQGLLQYGLAEPPPATSPPTPLLTDTTPDSPANDNTPQIKGSAALGSTVRLYANDPTCTTTVAAHGMADTFTFPGLTVNVSDNTTTLFYANAVNPTGTSPCSATFVTYTESSPLPQTTTDAGPAGTIPPPPGCSVRGNPIVGTAGNDTRNGSSGSDIMFGGLGRDLLRGLAGRDCLYGEAGGDHLSGGTGSDRLFGGAGGDRLRGGSGSDRLSGDSGADHLQGDAGNDRMAGGASRDRLTDRSGRDRFSGGTGNDIVNARDASHRGRRGVDSVRCGPGRRDLASVDRRDRVARDCERVRRR